jgi:hypothetical protein
MRNTIILPPNSDTVLIKVKPQPVPPRAIYDMSDCIPILGVKEATHDNTGLLRFNWRRVHHGFRTISDAGVFTHSAPYSIGQVVSVREAYYHGGFWQEQQKTEDNNFIEDEPWFWVKETVFEIPENPKMAYRRKSPATMPLSACRRKVEITAVDVVEIKGVFYWKITVKPQTK